MSIYDLELGIMYVSTFLIISFYFFVYPAMGAFLNSNFEKRAAVIALD